MCKKAVNKGLIQLEWKEARWVEMLGAAEEAPFGQWCLRKAERESVSYMR